MTKWLFFFLTLSRLAVADSALLLEAASAAAEGAELTPARVRALEALLTSSPDDASYAAYLLTFAASPARSWSDGALARLVLSTNDAEARLGKAAVDKLLRARADEAFEDGRFREAAIEFEKLRARTEGALQTYALLKAGWCHINLDDADAAFSAWRAAVENDRENAATISLWSGLGGAFIEAKQLPTDAPSFLNTSPHADAVLDGLDEAVFARSAPELADLRDRVGKLDLRPRLLARLAKAGRLSDRSACAVLTWITTEDPQSLVETVKPLVPACASSVETNAPTLDALWPRLNLSKDDREPRFDYYVAHGDSHAACREGLAWMIDDGNPPAKEIAAACEASRDSEPEILEALTNAARDRLRKPDEPLVYLATRFFTRAEFRSKLVALLIEQRERFAPTLLPALLAEREDEQAQALFEVFSTSGTAPTVWRSLSGKGFDRALLAGQSDVALTQLKRHFPLTDLSPATIHRWLAYLETNHDEEALTILLSPSLAEKHPDLAASLALAAIRFQRFEELAEIGPSLRAVPANQLETLSLHLFAELVDKSAMVSFPSSTPAPLLLATALREAVFDSAKISLLSPSGTGALAADARLLKQLTASRGRALGKLATVPLTEVPRWVEFLRSSRRLSKRHRWSHESTRAAAEAIEKDFCSSALTRSQGLVIPEGPQAAAVTNAIEGLRHKLAECAREAEVEP